MTARPIAVKPRVLVVDDNEQMRQVIESMLELMEFEVELAGDGATAVAMTGVTPYALVLMDVEMPVMDGLAATAAIRNREQAELVPAVPIIGITGHAGTGTTVLCRRAGMDDVMLKPFALSQLEEKLHALVDARIN